MPKEDIIDVVLKIDLHCDGCASKLSKSIRSFDGVESVKRVEGDLNKLKVVGNVDPAKLKEKIEQKTKKKVEILSPVIKKNNKDNNDKENNKKDANDKDKNNKSEDNLFKPKSDENSKKISNNKQLPMTTTVLKVNLHCEGCMQKIRKLVTKTKGYMEMSIDCQKDLVTVKGTVDVKALVEALKDKLKRSVEVVPSKKEGGGGGGEKKEKNVDSGKGGAGGVAGDKAAGGDGGDVKVEGNKMVVQNVPQYQYGYNYPDGYGSGYSYGSVHAPQLFSDENPNACVIM